MEVWQGLAEVLLAHDFDPVFGLMGDGNMRYVSEYQRRGGRFIAAAHEAAAVAMADGYSRGSGRIGVASVTHGPGLTNSVTSLVEAARNGSELLVLTGSAPPEPTYPQRLDMAAMARAAEAGYERVHVADQLVRDVDRTLQRIVAEGRPYVLDVPASIMAEGCELSGAVTAPHRPGPREVDSGDLDGALGLLLSAHRPVLIAGHGAVAADAGPAIVELAQRTGAMLATTLRARDLFRGHERDLGVFGSLSHQFAAEVIAEADAIVAFGASLNLFTTFKGELLDNKRVVHVDEDPSRIGEYTQVEEGIVADARLAAAAMNAALEEVGESADDAWATRTVTRLQGFDSRTQFRDAGTDNTVDLRAAMIAMDDLLPADRTVVCDVGRFTVGVWPYLRGEGPDRLINMGAFASIGLGLAGAIGAAVARPDQLTVAVLGDGGFMMNPVEVASAVRYLDRFMIIVCNDGAYGAEYYRLEELGCDPEHSLTHWPDLAPLGAALGAQTITVRSVADLQEHASSLASNAGTVLIDLRLDPDVNLIEW